MGLPDRLTFTIQIVICLGLIFLSVYIPSLENRKVFAQTFGQIKNLSGNLDSDCPVISVSGNNIFVAWRSFEVGDGDILFSKSTDGGETFSAPLDLSTSAESADCPEMTVSASNVYIVWEESIPNSFGFPVFFRSSFDGGATFNPIKQLSDIDDEDETPHPVVAASGKKSYVAWIHDFPNPSKTLFRRTLDGGGTFSNTKNLVTDSKIDAHQARIAISGDTVYVVWRGSKGNFEDSEIYIRISQNNGKDFGSTRNLSNNQGSSSDPVLKASGNNVYVAWVDETTGNGEIFLRRSTNQGSSFSGTNNLSKTTRDSFNPVLHLAGTTVYIAWTEGISKGDIFFKRSTDNGAHFPGRINLSNDLVDSSSPVMARDGNNVNIAWEGGDFDHLDILFRHSTDKGTSFGGVENISNSPNNPSFEPKIGSSNGNVYITWIEDLGDSSTREFLRGTGGQFATSNSSHIILALPMAS